MNPVVIVGTSSVDLQNYEYFSLCENGETKRALF